MGENSAIEWTTHTFNPWQGCTRLSPACDHCYAATLGARFGVAWGPTARRKFASNAYWQHPEAWDRRAERAREQHRVFCASMADVFELLPETHPDFREMSEARERLFFLIRDTPHLDWLLLTKRPQNIKRLVPSGWLAGQWPQNAWAGTTAETQRFADDRIPHLLALPAAVRFVSAEPLLGPIDFTKINLRPLGGDREGWTDALAGADFVCDSHAEVDSETHRIDWLICGGESGPGARPMHPDWARSLRDQCQAAGVAFHFKQAGQWDALEPDGQPPLWRSAYNGSCIDSHAFPDFDEEPKGWQAAPFDGALPVVYRNVGKKAAGRALDGVTHDAFPTVAAPDLAGSPR
jgi:protein gp37